MIKGTVRTFTVLAGLAGFFVFVGPALGAATGAVISLPFGAALVGGSFRCSDRLAVTFARARKIRPGEIAWLRAGLDRLASRAGMARLRFVVGRP